MNAAQAIAAALKARGVTKGYEQAALVGESPTMWSRYLKGHTGGPNAAKMLRWTIKARASGWMMWARVATSGWLADAWRVNDDNR